MQASVLTVLTADEILTYSLNPKHSYIKMKTKSKENLSFQIRHLFLMLVLWCGLQQGITAKLSLTLYPTPPGKQFAVTLGSGEGRGMCLNATSPILRPLKATISLLCFYNKKSLKESQIIQTQKARLTKCICCLYTRSVKL